MKIKIYYSIVLVSYLVKVFILGVFMKKMRLFCASVFLACFMIFIFSCDFTSEGFRKQIIYDEMMYELHNKIQNDPELPDIIPAIYVEKMVEEQNRELDKREVDFHIKDVKAGEDLEKKISLEDFKKRFVPKDLRKR